MFLLSLIIGCKPLDKLINAAVAEAIIVAENADYDFEEREDGEIIDADEQNDEASDSNENEEASSDSNSTDNSDSSDDEWDWEDNTEAEYGMETFAGEYGAFFEMYNSESGQMLCSAEAYLGVTNDGELWGEHGCVTPNGQDLQFWYEGELSNVQTYPSGNSYGSSAFGYAQAAGVVTMEAPSGDLFEAEFFGECYAEGNYVGMTLYFELVIQAPTELRYYNAYVYSY